LHGAGSNECGTAAATVGQNKTDETIAEPEVELLKEREKRGGWLPA
jgi:hypothetical protein